MTTIFCPLADFSLLHRRMREDPIDDMQIKPMRRTTRLAVDGLPTNLQDPRFLKIFLQEGIGKGSIKEMKVNERRTMAIVTMATPACKSALLMGGIYTHTDLSDNVYA